jgi:hypothetical protein
MRSSQGRNQVLDFDQRTRLTATEITSSAHLGQQPLDAGRNASMKPMSGQQNGLSHLVALARENRSATSRD